MTKRNLTEQAKEIVRLAEQSGTQSNFLFLTTFKRYQVQLNMLASLENRIKRVLNGEKNLFGISGELDARTITDYNRTVDSANKTANTLIKIIQTFNVQNREEEPDPLLKIVNGGEVDE